MTKSCARLTSLGGVALPLALAVALACGQATAQYKLMGPDGSVTYTDRPPLTSNVKVTSMARSGAKAPGAAEATLPAELRTAVQRHPVVLYTGADCAPCDTGRKLLQQRGVPYNERRVITEDDAAALERLVGGRTLPALSIGAQPLRGLSEADWTTYLDVAGYPRENKLPRNWLQPEAVPLTERAAPVARTPAAPPVSQGAPVQATVEPPAPGSIRF